MATPNDFTSIVSEIYQGMVSKGYTGTEADLAVALSALSDDNGATTKWIDLGASSAYAIAVEHGYTGTEDEWIALLMNITQNAQIAQESAESAAESAASARQSEEAIPTKKEEALQAIASAESDALQSVNTAGQAQVQAVNAAGATQVGLVQQEGSDQKDVVIAEGERQTQRVSSQGILEVQAVTNEGTTQVGNVSQEGTDQIAAIEQKGIDTRASIPPDYTALSDDVSALKSSLLKNTVYEVNDFTNIQLVKGYSVNTLGRPNLVSNSIANYASKSPYVYAGSTITINDGYLGSYAIWKVPVTTSTAVSERLELKRDISAGAIATIGHDGYLFCAVQPSDGSDLPSDKTPLEIISEALTINLLSGTVKDKIEEKIDKNQGTENAGKVLMVTQTGDVSPESISAPTEFIEAKTNYKFGKLSSTGAITTYKSAIVSDFVQVRKGDYITVDNGLYLQASLYNSNSPGASTFEKMYAWTNSGKLVVDADGYIVVSVSDSEHYKINTIALPNTDYQYDTHIFIQRTAFEEIADIESTLTEKRTIRNKTGLFEAQQAIASDWHLPFINVYDALGLGNNHQIPGTATTWSSSGATDLTQKNVWMSDGTHPYRGVGLVDMYGRTIANQLALVSPSYHDGDGEDSPSYWAGKRILWMGTSIPAGSDPDAGSGTGATYPQMVATQLGATSVNIARGSSMLRVKSSTGLYNAIPFSHYARAITRMVAECDEIAANWANIYSDIPNAPSELTAENIATMKNHSFENLVVPYLDGTNTAPDLYVIDYGHNDYSNGIDGLRDWWIQPTSENIESGLLAEDTYMVTNDYANLKLAFNNDLSGISDLPKFAASVNRNCFQGACNFLITVILRYKPYARIVIVSDYN